MGQRLQRATKTTLRPLRRLGHTPDLSFHAREECNQQVRFMKRICAQDQCFRLARHGSLKPFTTKDTKEHRAGDYKSEALWRCHALCGLGMSLKPFSRKGEGTRRC